MKKAFQKTAKRLCGGLAVGIALTAAVFTGSVTNAHAGNINHDKITKDGAVHSIQSIAGTASLKDMGNGKFSVTGKKGNITYNISNALTVNKKLIVFSVANGKEVVKQVITGMRYRTLGSTDRLIKINEGSARLNGNSIRGKLYEMIVAFGKNVYNNLSGNPSSQKDLHNLYVNPTIDPTPKGYKPVRGIMHSVSIPTNTY